MEAVPTAGQPGPAVLEAEHRIIDEVRHSADTAGVRIVELAGRTEGIVDLAVEAI